MSLNSGQVIWGGFSDGFEMVLKVLLGLCLKADLSLGSLKLMIGSDGFSTAVVSWQPIQEYASSNAATLGTGGKQTHEFHKSTTLNPIRKKHWPPTNFLGQPLSSTEVLRRWHLWPWGSLHRAPAAALAHGTFVGLRPGPQRGARGAEAGAPGQGIFGKGKEEDGIKMWQNCRTLQSLIFFNRSFSCDVFNHIDVIPR